MKRWIEFYVVVCLVIITGGCSLNFTVSRSAHVSPEEPGKIVTEDRRVAFFRNIDVSGGITVYVTEGKDAGLTVTAPENYLPRIETEVLGDQLFVRLKGKDGSKLPGGIKVDVVAPEITAMTVCSYGEIITTSALERDDIFLTAYAHGKFSVEMNTKRVKLNLTTGSRTELKGITGQMTLEASTTARVNAENLRAKEAYVTVSKSAEVILPELETLYYEVVSDGKLDYPGSPRIMKRVVNTGGMVNVTE